MKFNFTSHDSGNHYTLSSENGVLTCTCPDFEYRSGPEGRQCKHIREFTGTYQIVPESHAHVLATLVQELRHEAFNAPTRTRTAINTVVGFLGQELAEEVLSS